MAAQPPEVSWGDCRKSKAFPLGEQGKPWKLSPSVDASFAVNARAHMTDDCKKGIAKFLEK